MIFGIGIDIIEVARMEKEIARRSGLQQAVFTDKEIAYCESKQSKAQNYAARFAVKEAFLKALGTGLRDGLAWKEIEIVNDDLGKPELVLSGKAKKVKEDKQIANMHVSLSHVKEMAVAAVVLET